MGAKKNEAKVLCVRLLQASFGLSCGDIVANNTADDNAAEDTEEPGPTPVLHMLPLILASHMLAILTLTFILDC